MRVALTRIESKVDELTGLVTSLDPRGGAGVERSVLRRIGGVGLSNGKGSRGFSAARAA
jgi:hypothetical protein